MFERPKSGERAVLVHQENGVPDPDELAEFRDLAVSAGAIPAAVVLSARKSPDPRLFIGRGKTEEVKAIILAEQAELVIFNHELAPSQERNLEREFQCRVVDRTGLILDIFAQRARSFEGKLQVELAQLRHLATRLVRGWTHLERQKGGIGLRGPGETQLETDRRLLNGRIVQIKRRLERVDSRRHEGRRARLRAEIPTVSLVGYTNAGKSTLFNRLTAAGVYAADQLFATLDPTLRRVDLLEGEGVVLADTVGFISHLPHDLVASFKSTLQETVAADLLLHVVDVASHRRDHCIREVNSVLEQIGADAVPQIEVFNKIDSLEDSEPRVETDEEGRVRRVWISARDGRGVDELLQVLGEFFRSEQVSQVLRLSPSEGRLRAKLFQLGRVTREEITEEGGWELSVRLPKIEFDRLLQQDYALRQRLV